MVGAWSAGTAEIVFTSDGAFTSAATEGVAAGTYLINNTGDEPRLILTTETSTVPNAQFGEPCTGRDRFALTFNGDKTATVAYLEGPCDLSWPAFLTLVPSGG